MSLNPQCQVNNGGVPAVVGAGASVEIELVTPAGADFWGITAIGTDETSNAATINASLVVNQVTKKATFTAPAGLGSAVIFQSTVGVQGSGSAQGSGRDANGVLQPSFTTTFKVNVPTITGLHVIAENEVYEENTSSGWIAELNATIRSPGAGSFSAWINLTHASTGAVLPSGPAQVNVTLNTKSGACGFVFPASPTDGLIVRVADPPTGGPPLTCNWATTAGTATGNAGQYVELPTALGTFSALAGTVSMPSVNGAVQDFQWIAADSVWKCV